MKSKKKQKSRTGKKIHLAVDRLMENEDLDPRLGGHANFMDLVTYGDKFEAGIDDYNDQLALQGNVPKDIGMYIYIYVFIIIRFEIGFTEIKKKKKSTSFKSF